MRRTYTNIENIKTQNPSFTMSSHKPKSIDLPQCYTCDSKTPDLIPYLSLFAFPGIIKMKETARYRSLVKTFIFFLNYKKNMCSSIFALNMDCRSIRYMYYCSSSADYSSSKFTLQSHGMFPVFYSSLHSLAIEALLS